jgi:cell division transport system permease protein
MLKAKRILKTSLENFFRNGWLSLTATLIMMLALIIVGVFSTMTFSANKVVSQLKNKVDIVVNFKDTASEAQIQQMKATLLAREGISSVKYISKNDALVEFQSRQSVRQDIREMVTSEDNPLPRGLQIQSVDPKEFEYVSDLAKSGTYASIVDSSTYDDNKDLITKIDSGSRFVERMGLGLAIFFVVIAAMVVANTVKLAVAFRSNEIEVMRLVGASESFVKIPFLIEGFLYAFFGLILSAVIIYFGFGLIGSIAKGTDYEQFYSLLAPVYYQNFWIIVLVQLGVGTIISIGSSWFSTRRNVKL